MAEATQPPIAALSGLARPNERGPVLVTGVAGYWGSRVAKRLAERHSVHVMGLDSEQPAATIADVEFIRADLRDPSLVDLLKDSAAQAVCHLAYTDWPSSTSAEAKQSVVGTKSLLRACAEAGVPKVIVKSCMSVYGARSDNPAFLTEDNPLHGSRRARLTDALVEIESFCNGFRSQVPAMVLTILRFASIVGPTADTPMNRFLGEQWAPSLFGFDPMMQVIHEDDVVGAFLEAVLRDAPGAFNVAAEGVFPLNKIRGLAGKTPFVVMLPSGYARAGHSMHSPLWQSRGVPIDPDLIRYRWVGDLTQMRQVLGFQPHYTAEQALREFGARRGRAQAGPAAGIRARGERRLQHILRNLGLAGRREATDDEQ